MKNKEIYSKFLNNDTFLDICSSSSSFRKFWKMNEEIIAKRIKIDFENTPGSGRRGEISQIQGTNDYRVRIRITSDTDCNAYTLAHEICHGLIYIQGYPRCEIPRYLLTDLILKKENDILKNLQNMCCELNTLFYDPLVNRHLENYEFDLDEIYKKINDKTPDIDLKITTEYRKATLTFLYSTMKIEISNYYPSGLENSKYLSWFDTNCPEIVEDSLENIHIVEKCYSRTPDEVKNCILRILKRYEMKGEPSAFNILLISPGNDKRI